MSSEEPGKTVFVWLSSSPTLEFHDAGHVLGSAGLMVRGSTASVFYTRDVCFRDQTILKSARFADVQADVLIMETTRGNRDVPASVTRETEIERLTLAIDRALWKPTALIASTTPCGSRKPSTSLSWKRGRPRK